MTEVALNDIAEITSSKRIFYSDYVDDGIPFYRSREIINLDNGEDLKELIFITQEKYQDIKNKFGAPTKNDILITSVGTIGNTYLVREEDEFYFKDGNLTWLRRWKDNVEPKFVLYWIKSPVGQGELYSQLIGSSQKALTISALKKIKINLPPLPTQRKIASILSAYDDLIENNLKRIKLLEEKAFASYKLIVQNEKLEKISVFDYAEIMSGGTPSTTNPNFWEGEIPFFTPKDLSSQSGYYLDDTERKITELGLEKCNSRLFPRDTIFITARGTVGKLVLAKIPTAISQSNYAVTTRNGSSNYFLFLALIDKIDHFKQLAVGGVFDTIIVDTFKMIFLELPNETVINQFNIDIKPVFQLIDTLQKQNTKLREARDILLPRLMNGQIEV